MLDRTKAGSNLRKRGARERRNPMSDPIITMSRVPAKIAIEAITHMDQLFGHHDLQRSGL
ncbi:MAG: hypothetical protein M3Q03_20940 [Chloroflexota bacterium]|nr:hypothetical protein [Chloroflexota bacterium]